MPDTEIEQLIQQHGEQHRQVITDAITWLREREPKWNLQQPIDKALYIQSLLPPSATS